MAQEETVKHRDTEDTVIGASAFASLLLIISAGLGLGLGFYLWG